MILFNNSLIVFNNSLSSCSIVIWTYSIIYYNIIQYFSDLILYFSIILINISLWYYSKFLQDLFQSFSYLIVRRFSIPFIEGIFIISFKDFLWCLYQHQFSLETFSLRMEGFFDQKWLSQSKLESQLCPA